MTKAILTLGAALALSIGVAATPAQACDGDKACDCNHGAKGEKAGAHHGKTARVAAKAKAQKVSLEGKIVTSGCPMEAAKAECTGAALVVGDTEYMIKKGGKGAELVTKAKDTDKVVKVSGTKAGEYLTVAAYQFKS